MNTYTVGRRMPNGIAWIGCGMVLDDDATVF